LHLQPAPRHSVFGSGWRTGGLCLLGLFCVALAIRVVVVALVQPKLGADTVGYLADARAIAQNGPAGLVALRLEHAPLYSLLLAVGLFIPVLEITWFAALSQAIVGAATVAVLARLTTRETRSANAGICAGGIAAVQISFVFWTAYVLSDTLFLFLVALCADRLLLLRDSSNTARDAALIGFLTLVTIAARPTGAAFAVAVLPVLVMAGRRDVRKLAIVLGGFALPFVLLIAIGLAGTRLSGSDLPEATAGRLAAWVRSGVENGLLWTESGRATSGVDVDVYPPPVLHMLPPEQQDEFLQLGPLGFAARHPEFVLQQDLRKLRMFWTPVLPEYSLPHAIATGLYFVAFYVFALTGFAHARRLTSLVALVSSSVLLFTLTSLITFVDYDQRYRLPAELLLVPLAGVGLAGVLQRVLIRGTHRQPPVESSHAEPLLS
jgi:hypothetical protein